MSLLGQIELPYICPDGTRATLGLNTTDCGGMQYGYPPMLYPNLTYSTTSFNGSQVAQASYDGDVIGPFGKPALVLGPYPVNSTFSILSMTMPIINNSAAYDVLGFYTVVLDGRLISEILDSTDGLGKTGETLIVRPINNSNLFSSVNKKLPAH